MKTIISTLFVSFIVILSAESQPVTNYVYKLDNGITVKSEHCWNQVWVQQGFSPVSGDDKAAPLTVNIRALGDLISGSEYKLLNGNKEVKLQGAAPGTYELQLNFKLSGKPGKLSFVVGNIVIKEKTRTTVSVILYDYQLNIAEKQSPMGGLAEYVSEVNRCKSHTVQEPYEGLPAFYEKGKHDKALTPDKVVSKTSGKIKAGAYDVLITMGIGSQTQKVWLENFQLKPDVSYHITLNLNAGGIVYTGGNPDVKALHLYPAGTAQKQTGKAEPIKNMESISYDNITIANCCSPGTYDVLLQYAKGSKYEWRKNIAVSTGVRTEVK